MMFSCSPAAATNAAHVGRRAGRGPKHFTVDIHCHVETPEASDLVSGVAHPPENAIAFSNEASREVNRKQQESIRVAITSVEARLQHMDRTGIDIQAVSTSPGQYYYWTEPELGRQTARLINENIARIVADHPDRFVGLATVPLQAPELAVGELEHAVKELGMRGVEICTNVNGTELSHERFRRFFAKAEELGILIFMHPSGFTQGQRLSDHYFINVIGNPLDSTVAVHHLIFDGVLERYPGLKIVVAHGGGYLPAYSGRIDHAHGARTDCRRVISKKPTSYLKKLYFDTIVFTHHQLEYLAQQYGADHIMLGTDYPYDMALPKAVRFVESADLAEREKVAILGGNAARLLKIKLPKTAAPARSRPRAKAKAKAKRRR
ncbi:MAG TPA: amidohydrolase family protein [Stellaceae bacterium]|nr:amidohydrolase family protein [Stellaceae bacterium]